MIFTYTFEVEWYDADNCTTRIDKGILTAKGYREAFDIIESWYGETIESYKLEEFDTIPTFTDETAKLVREELFNLL